MKKRLKKSIKKRSTH